MTDGAYRRTDNARGVLEEIALAGDERLLTHPDQHCSEGVALQGRLALCIDQHFASTEIDLIFQSDSDTPGRTGRCEVAIVGDNAAHARDFATWQCANGLPNAEFTALNPAGETTKGS